MVAQSKRGSDGIPDSMGHCAIGTKSVHAAAQDLFPKVGLERLG